MTFRLPPKIETGMLRFWHAWLAGSFLIAYVTADEDTYALHLFAGYAVLAAIAVRLLVGVVMPVGSPLRLPPPSVKGLLAWLAERKGRNPLFAWFASVLLAAVGVSAVTGALADGWTWLEDPHEAVSELALGVVFGHVAFVTFMYGGKRWLARLFQPRKTVTPVALACALLAAPVIAEAGDARRDAIVAGYAAEARAADAAFAGVSAERGEKLFRTPWAGGDARTPSCTACHTENPQAPGRNAKTGRAIDPVAVSANPKRFTDRDEVEKQFGRDCKSVLGRACTAREKGDYIAFMTGQ
jgi:cytochrome c553